MKGWSNLTKTIDGSPLHLLRAALQQQAHRESLVQEIAEATHIVLTEMAQELITRATDWQVPVSLLALFPVIASVTKNPVETSRQFDSWRRAAESFGDHDPARAVDEICRLLIELHRRQIIETDSGVVYGNLFVAGDVWQRKPRHSASYNKVSAWYTHALAASEAARTAIESSIVDRLTLRTRFHDYDRPDRSILPYLFQVDKNHLGLLRAFRFANLWQVSGAELGLLGTSTELLQAELCVVDVSDL